MKIALLVLSCISLNAAVSPLRVPGALLPETATAGGPTFILDEGFDGTGYETGGITESGAGTIDEDYTTTILSGTHSLHIVASSGTAYAQFQFPANYDTNHVKFLFRPLADTTGRILTIKNSSATTLADIAYIAGGTVQARNGNSGGASTVATMSVGTTYYCWVEWRKGTGANGYCSFAFDTVNTEPTSGDNFAAHTIGNATTQSDTIQMGAAISSTVNFVADDYKVTTTETIGSF